MAVSGRELADFSGSLSIGSAEDVDYNCDPCLTCGQQVEAHKYCVDCEEYLCTNCSDCHLKTKLSRNHKLVDNNTVDKQPTTKDSEVCTDKCPEHKQEMVKYFCPRHEALGCHVCIIMHHKTCEVDYIPDKCADIANSEVYRRTVYRLDLKLQELNEISQTTKSRDQEIDHCHQYLLQEITEVRREINNYLDQLQQKIQKEADTKKTEDKQITQRILDKCNNLSADIKKMQSTLQAYEISGKYGQLYIEIKQAQSVLRSEEILAKEDLDRTAKQYVFECNSSLTNMLSKQDALGKLSLRSLLKTQRTKKKTFQKISEKENIDISTKSDEIQCLVTGCALLSPDKVLLLDGHNHKLKLLNMNTKSVVEETSLNSAPWDVAVLSQHEIAVTMPEKREVVIMICGDRLSTVHTISVSARCRGITHHHGQLYVVCDDPLCVLTFDKQGNVQNKISLNKDIVSEPYYLVVSEDSKLLYISDFDKDYIVSTTLQGEVTAVYKKEDLVRPGGMLVLDDGSLLVCSWQNGFIHRISGDLKKGQTVIDDLKKPQSICFSHLPHEVYIGGWCNQLTVLNSL